MTVFGTYVVPMTASRFDLGHIKLTKRNVEAAKPDPDRDKVLWDTEISGFGLRVWPSGRRVYILKYRTSEGRQRKVTIGQHGPITAEQARKMALRWRGEGSDPASAKSAARKAPTIRELAERYMAEHAAVKKAAR